MKVLIADDEESLVNFLYRGLCVEGFECTKELQLHNVETHARREQPDVIILDRMFNDEDSINIIERLKRLPHSPMVLLLTALDDVIEKIAGLDKGADDYLCKPFDFDELIARVNALCRRAKSNHETSAKALRCGNIELDLDARIAKSFDENTGFHELSLTNIEFNLLQYLMESQNKLLTRERILSRVWQSNSDPLTNIVDVYISRLRQKMPPQSGIEIVTLRGNGYRLQQTHK
ncbi:DNA-binding response regulator [Alteromonas sp. KUL42]|uniref:response regulator transcription factor n=1 Tax=Alteromonas sp. KUL42 TaxID=2480797 RepID=UPI0010369959|nr:response regulator transcription factor [Alteromonas sp. KUL42]TAP31789.1 response regulator transcription factor [Alteromonas sp. KUL42]GEA09206.1 DNA-binding response regulator [Alteromonas sp. KUL42]